MKIFVIEDERASIESAKMQLGEDHELTFFTTAMEVRRLLGRLATGHEKPDIILTDVNIPMGEAGCYSVKDHYSPSDLVPAGLVVALRATTVGIPTVIVTDSNSHQDIIGLLLDDAQLSSKDEMIYTWTRPGRVTTPFGEGKDWIAPLYGGSIESMVEYLT